MNRIIYTADDCLPTGEICLTDIRALHIRDVLHASLGQSIKIGLLNGPIGLSKILSISPSGEVLLSPMEEQSPSLLPWFDILLAMPRPRALKRLLPQLATIGVRTIYLVRSSKVPKSYFDSPCLRADSIHKLFIEGLMQAGTTILPTYQINSAGLDLTILPKHGLRLLCHPGNPQSIKCSNPEALPLLAVGPDGGWTNDEIDNFHYAGFIDFALGSRPLRTDTACIALTAVLQERLQRGAD